MEPGNLGQCCHISVSSPVLCYCDLLLYSTMENSDNITPLFFKAKDLADKNVNTYDICEAVFGVVGRDGLHGAQRIRGLWRLYLKSDGAKKKLLTEGLCIGGLRVTIYTENPFSANLQENMSAVKLTIKDIPLSYSNDEVQNFLVNLGAQTTCEIKFSKARDRSGALTEFLNGDRYVYLNKDHTLAHPLPRFSVCGSFNCRLFHEGQPAAFCTNCQSEGHTKRFCTKPKVCLACKCPGHAEGDAVCECYEENSCTLFGGSNDPLSNFHQSSFEYSGIVVPSAEHAYQYRKAMMNGKPDIAKQILDTKTPWEAKKLARDIKCDSKWEKENVKVMVDIITAKFEHVPEARDALLASSETIAEAVPGQFFWGTGMSKDASHFTSPSAWPGENHLGKILMKVRDGMMASGDRSRHRSRSDQVRNRSRSKRKLSGNSPSNQSPSRVRCLNATKDSSMRLEYR